MRLLLTSALALGAMAAALAVAALAQEPTAPPPDRAPAESPGDGRGEAVEVRALGANVRAGPAMAAAVLAVVGQGCRLPVLGRSSNWVRVELDDGRAGWIYGTLVAPVAAAEVAAAPAAPRPDAREGSAGAPAPRTGASEPIPPSPAGTAPAPAQDRGDGAALGQPAPPPPPPSAERAAGAATATERLARFRATVAEVNERARRAVGVDVFAEVEELGGGAVALTATEAWHAAPEAARRANLATLVRFWSAMHEPAAPVAVRIVDEQGEVLLEERRGATQRFSPGD